MIEKAKTDTVPVLVIVLESPMKAVEELEEYRDHVLKGLSAGVLVFGKGVNYRIEEFPPLSGVMVRSEYNAMSEESVIRAHDYEDLEQPGEVKKRSASADKETKTEILNRLKKYRNDHGLGCLEAVAKATRSKTLTAMILRDVLLGTAVLEKSDWIKIGRALDKLEVKPSEKEGENG